MWYILRYKSLRVHLGVNVLALWDTKLQQWCLRRDIFALHSIQEFLLVVQAPEAKIRSDSNLSKGVSSFSSHPFIEMTQTSNFFF